MQPCAFIIPYSNMKLLKPLITLPHSNIPNATIKNWDHHAWLCRYGSHPPPLPPPSEQLSMSRVAWPWAMGIPNLNSCSNFYLFIYLLLLFWPPFRSNFGHRELFGCSAMAIPNLSSLFEIFFYIHWTTFGIESFSTIFVFFSYTCWTIFDTKSYLAMVANIVKNNPSCSSSP
jgi:hypothetical protein